MTPKGKDVFYDLREKQQRLKIEYLRNNKIADIVCPKYKNEQRRTAAL